jgi:hypothetical protein
MGVEYNQCGEECESRKASQREEIRMGWDNKAFRTIKLCMGIKREQETKLEDDATMEG